MQLDRIAEQIIANSNLPSRGAGRSCRQATSIAAFFFFKLAVCLPLLRANISFPPSCPELVATESDWQIRVKPVISYNMNLQAKSR